jgi:hypothetical protein
VRRNEQPRENVVVGENQKIRDAVELGDLPRMLERTTAFAEYDEVRTTGEGVEERLEGAREAGREIQEDGVAGRRKGRTQTVREPRQRLRKSPSRKPLIA